MSAGIQPRLTGPQEAWLRANPEAGPLIATTAAKRVAGQAGAFIDAAQLARTIGRPGAAVDFDMSRLLIEKYAEAFRAMGDLFGMLRAGASAKASASGAINALQSSNADRPRLPRIACAQMLVKAGLPLENYRTIERMVSQAATRGAELVVFPEMCVGGYLIGDNYQRNADLLQDLVRYNDLIKGLSAKYGIAIAWGNICLDTVAAMKKRGLAGTYHPNPDGTLDRRFNAFFMAQNGAWVRKNGDSNLLPEGVMAKTLFPDERYYDDSRFFTSLADHARDFGVSLAETLQPFMLKVDGREVALGGIICQDGWPKPYRANLEMLSPAKMQVENGAEAIIAINSSAWASGKEQLRADAMHDSQSPSGDGFIPHVYVNHVGAMNNNDNLIVFDGGSMATGPTGAVIARSSKSFQEDLVLIDDLRSTAPVQDPAPSVPARYTTIAKKYEAIVHALQNWKHAGGRKTHPKVIIGLSGGIDSSVAAALWVKAVGAENVIGINMPTDVNSAATKHSAHKLAAALGIPITDIPVGRLARYKNYLLKKHDLDGSKLEVKRRDQECGTSKVRAMILSDFAAKHSTREHVSLVSNNSNKLEATTGYLAIDGDGRGAVCPGADLWKVETYELARYLNEHVFGREVIPSELLPDDAGVFAQDAILSGAELSAEQINPLKHGYHDALGMLLVDHKASEADVLNWYLEGTLHKQMASALRASGAPLLADHAEDLIRRYGLDHPRAFLHDLDWFMSAYSRATYKRGQFSLIVSVGPATFGQDLREAQLPRTRTKHALQLGALVKGSLLAYGVRAPPRQRA